MLSWNWVEQIGGAGYTNNSEVLSDSEFAARRARNQCYFCDAPYTKGHNCRKKRQLMIMEIVPDEVGAHDSEDDSSTNERKELVEVPPIIDIEEPLIRLQVMADGGSTTMQLKGSFTNRRVHVLIDSGATHNFIHPRLLKGTKVPVHKFKPLNVLLASGAKMQTHGEAHLELQLQDFKFAADYYVLPLTGCEIVLGTNWLKTLGDIVWNFEFMQMKFGVNGVLYQLQGDHLLSYLQLDTMTTKLSCFQILLQSVLGLIDIHIFRKLKLKRLCKSFWKME